MFGSLMKSEILGNVNCCNRRQYREWE